MWIPKSADEIERAVDRGDLQETMTFEAKEDFPKKSKSLAEDLVAMANEGGVIVIGIGDDENKRLVRRTPIPIKDAGERVNNIVATCISPPLHVDIITHATAEDPAVGYLVIAVPFSPNVYS